MENKINVAELLKDCQQGMKLDCAIFENLEFDHVDKNSKYPIVCRIELEGGNYNTQTFSKYGCYTSDKFSKCAIFPKGKTTWEGFQRPFVEGDIVSTECGIYIGIVKSTEDSHSCDVFCAINDNDDLFIDKNFLFSRFATEEEKEKLFKVIKNNGYHWDNKTKTLEKLASSNIDVNTLKPFEKVLVRDHNDCIWRADFYSHYEHSQQYWFVCVGDAYKQCIPYNKETAKLLSTDYDCPDKYKIWKNNK